MNLLNSKHTWYKEDQAMHVGSKPFLKYLFLIKIVSSKAITVF